MFTEVILSEFLFGFCLGIPVGLCLFGLLALLFDGGVHVEQRYEHRSWIK